VIQIFFDETLKMPSIMPAEQFGIMEVWKTNLEEEFRKIYRIVQKYPYVAMDTEFPGVVARPVGEFKTTAEYQYQLLRCNVDLLKIIQVGLTFMDEQGQTATPTATWQFNFKFNLSEDMYAQDSIELLSKCGIDFKKHEQLGMEANDFAELLIGSGIVLSDTVHWISFHSGYDFGYMLKLLTCSTLPPDEHEFFEMIKIYFPKIYDIKYLMKSTKHLKGGLQEVADELEVTRTGPQHQAGSDSLLTGATFFRMRELFFEDHIDDKYCGHLYGLGVSFVSSDASAANASAVPATAASSLVTATNNNADSSSTLETTTTNGDAATPIPTSAATTTTGN